MPGPEDPVLYNRHGLAEVLSYLLVGHASLMIHDDGLLIDLRKAVDGILHDLAPLLPQVVLFGCSRVRCCETVCLREGDAVQLSATDLAEADIGGDLAASGCESVLVIIPGQGPVDFYEC